MSEAAIYRLPVDYWVKTGRSPQEIVHSFDQILVGALGLFWFNDGSVLRIEGGVWVVES